MRLPLLALSLLLAATAASAQEAPSPDSAPEAAPIVRQAPAQSQQPEPPPPSTTPSHYDKAIFLKPMTPAQLAGLDQTGNMTSGELFGDHQFRKLTHSFVPDCTFHYGRDLPLDQALDYAISGSRTPVQLRDNRYLLLSGDRGPVLGGRAFLWIDLKDGIGLGGFYFHPVNGEPTPTLNVFSRQVREDSLSMTELPPAFLQDLDHVSNQLSLPTVSTTYFLTGDSRKILLEHDDDFCSPSVGLAYGSGPDCEQLNADAADVDEVAAYFVEQTHHATNATAWMLGPDQTAFLQVRDRACGGVADPLACRIRLTREHTHIIVHRPPRHI